MSLFTVAGSACSFYLLELIEVIAFLKAHIVTDLALPLGRYPLVDTRRIDDFQTCIQHIFGDHTVDLPSGANDFHAQLNFCPLRSIGVFYGAYGAPLRVSFNNIVPFIIGVPLAGRGEHAVNGTPQDMMLAGLPPAIAANTSLQLNFASDFAHLALCIDPHLVTKKLAALVDTAPVHPVEFATTARFERPEARALRGLIEFLVDELNRPKPHLGALALAELEQSVMVSYLCSTPNNYSSLLTGKIQSIGPWQVTRVEEYVEANWDKPLSAEELATAINANVRTIFQSFKQSRGYSPMSFVKQVRLRHARRMLSAPKASTSVSEVALACGFGNLGHFAKDYLQSFGERPSATLNAARGMRPRKSEA